MNKRRWLVTWWTKEGSIVEARTPDEAARFCRQSMGTTYRDIIVYADDDLAGDRPIRMTLPEVPR